MNKVLWSGLHAFCGSTITDLLQNLLLAIKLSSKISVLILFLVLFWSQGELQKCEPLKH